ncbi:MAG: ribosome small subunit-dependent GTPase A [Cytophagales bacterium]|nr:ribosome small subunit-dependent GTPase A [Cytophagales bacterium]MDW8384506.1 ribosome small subunit-dependent GTPase A [Flammeovirgaceae bacterium]
MQKAVVLKSTGSWYEILDENTHQILKARLRGKIKLKELKVTNPIAVGDIVAWEWEKNTAHQAIILDILPRENYIMRSSTHKTAHGHILAANIDGALLVATLAFPRTSFGFIDRFLVTAESFRIPVCIVFNKIDLLTSEEEKEYLDEICHMYERIGYDTMRISAINKDENLFPLQEYLKGKRTLIAGHSGVGKSTLINRLAPHVNQKTAEISTFNKGVHTTTFAEMFEIAPQTFLIDTPGIKEWGIIDMEPEEVGHYFPEFRARLNECKFHSCTHTHEPGCAIRLAVENGEIALTRYESYLSIFSGEDNRK